VQIFASFTDVELAGYIEPLPTIFESRGLTAPLVQESGKVDRGYINKEAKQKAQNNVEVGVPSALTTVNKIVESIPVIGGLVTEFAGLLGSILDKPSSIAMTQPIQLNFARDWIGGEGQDYGNRHSLLKESYLSNNLKLMGNISPKTSLMDIMKVPMIMNISEFTHTNGALYFNILPFGMRSSLNSDYMEYVFRHFGYIRDTYKIALCFYTSSFVSCRFKVSIYFQTPAAGLPDSGNVVSTVVDVKGDTVFSMYIPFLYRTLYRYCTDSTIVARLAIETISPIMGQSLGTNPTIYCVIWKAAGEDTQVSQLVGRYAVLSLDAPKEEKKKKKKKKKETPLTEQSILRLSDLEMSDDIPLQQQWDPQEHYSRSFTPIIHGIDYVHLKGICVAEDITLLNDCLKRYASINVSPTATHSTYPDATQIGAFQSFSNIFQYWTGGRNYKFVINNTPGTSISNNSFVITSLEGPDSLHPIDPGAGLNYTNPALWPVIEGSVPYYSTMPFQPTEPAQQVIFDAVNDRPVDYVILVNGVSYVTSSALITMVSAADDFQYGWLRAPNL